MSILFSTLSSLLAPSDSRRPFLSLAFMGAAVASLLAASPVWARPGLDDPDGAFDPCPPSEADVTLRKIEIRPGVTGDVHLHVINNPRPWCVDEAIVAIAGAAASASTLNGLGHSIFAQGDEHEMACRFIGVDLPAHGSSPLPQGALFGDLTLEDYAAVVLGALDRLEDHGVRTTTLVAHSMGGLVVELAQQALVSRGTSLREEHDVRHVVLFAAAGPAAIPCAYCQNQQVAAALAPFIGFDPALGPRFSIPDALWPMLPFTLPDGDLASNAPTPAEVTEYGYNSIESLGALSELLGVPPVPRPDVSPGIFADRFGTTLDMAEFQNDTIVLPSENQALHHYLRGNDDPSGFAVVDGANAVHGTPISEPQIMLASLRGRLRLP